MEKRNPDNYLVGLWKFENTIFDEELVRLAEEWAKDENYEVLYIRGASKTQRGICFVYRYDGTEEGQKKYHYETTDDLRRRFGNGLAGWDYSTAFAFVKGL